MVDSKVDLIIIGAGPNGLSLGAYLSKAGLKVLVLERRPEVGGGLATEEVTLHGHLHNTHAVYMMMADYAPIYQDFQMEQNYNVHHIYPELQFVLPLSDALRHLPRVHIADEGAEGLRLGRQPRIEDMCASDLDFEGGFAVLVDKHGQAVAIVKRTAGPAAGLATGLLLARGRSVGRAWHDALCLSGGGRAGRHSCSPAVMGAGLLSQD